MRSNGPHARLSTQKWLESFESVGRYKTSIQCVSCLMSTLTLERVISLFFLHYIMKAHCIFLPLDEMKCSFAKLRVLIKLFRNIYEKSSGNLKINAKHIFYYATHLDAKQMLQILRFTNVWRQIIRPQTDGRNHVFLSYIVQEKSTYSLKKWKMIFILAFFLFNKLLVFFSFFL